MSLPYSRAFTPPAPVLEVDVFNINQSDKRLRVSAKLDTGADVSAIPAEAREPLALLPAGTILVEGFEGSPIAIASYWVGLELPNARIRRVKVIETSEAYALLGRDILNLLYISLRGPELSFAISPKPL